MRAVIRTTLSALLLIAPASALRAQTAVDPSGHWQGSVELPGREVAIEVDFSRNDKGVLTGTINNPDEKMRGLPLRVVALTGASISFNARRDQPFEGTLSPDGKTMSGEYLMSGYALPFRMRRTGEAEVFAPERSAPIGKELEGRWNGTLNVGGKSMRLQLTLLNQPDGTATGTIVSVDEGELELPVTFAQQASTLTLNAGMTGASYSGVLSADGTELAGTFTQRDVVAPLTFRATKP